MKSGADQDAPNDFRQHAENTHAADSDIHLHRTLFGDDPRRRAGHHYRKPEPAENASVDHRARVRSGRRARLLLLLRAESLQAADHLPQNPETNLHAAGRDRRNRTGRDPRTVETPRPALRKRRPRRAALRKPDHPLYRRKCQDGGAPQRDPTRRTSHPSPILHPLR